MTNQTANIIKHLRCSKGYSWRMISLSIDGIEDQIHGMDLCDEAMKLLNEKVEDGWN